MFAMCIVGVLGIISAGIYVAVVPESDRKPRKNDNIRPIL